jgi:predicted esterase
MRRWQLGTVGVLVGLLAGLAPAHAQSPALAPTPAPSPDPSSTDGVRLALSRDGHFGAMLVSGVWEHGKPADEEHLSPRLGGSVGAGSWKVASGSGAIDLAAALGVHSNDLFAEAGGVLHVEQAGRYTLLVGADDGLWVTVDGQRLLARDEARPQRDDDDLVPLDLTAGDHTVVFGLHQRTGAWTLRARVLDAELQPPKGASWVLPGAGPDVAASLAAGMSSLHLDRSVGTDGYRLALTVTFPEGVPRDVPLPVHARLTRASTGAGATPRTLFDVSAGDLAAGERGIDDVTIALPRVAGSEVEDDDWALHVDVAGRGVDLPFHPRRAVREAIAHADRGLAARPDDSVQYLRDRLAGFVARGDGEVDAQLDDARELDALAAPLEEQRDPWADRSGPMRRAYRSPLDGKLSEFALYVPPDLDPDKKIPLIVALHGMNGHPMQMLQWLFGHDDPVHDGTWEDRHPRRELEKLDAIVVAPGGHFNTMYRDLGEEDVMRVTDWAMAHYPVDEARVTITGPSMGGIGTAACALHHPDRFAAAEPLCGYHSYFVRGDIGGRAMKPWEHFIAEERSNSMWAENGLYIPMFVVHGTRDLPEENSKVLIDRYDELHYAMKHEHPDLGHNVWQTTYEDLKGARWLLWHQRPLHPRALRFKTPSTRWADDAWVHVKEMASSEGWGEVFARIDKQNGIHASVRGIRAIAFDRDAEKIDDTLPVDVVIDGSKATFQAGQPIEMHKVDDAWAPGPAPHAGLYKHGAMTGPLRDVLHEPLLFVYGASDPAQTRANEETARAWAKVKWGVHVDYPVMSDVEFAAKGEALGNERALFLVGNARSNALVRELEPGLPIRIEGDDVVVGGAHVTPTDGPADRSQLGVAFIYPNPKRSDRYVVVVEGVGALGTWRSTSLPDMLPDYVVYDAGVGPARGALILGSATVRGGGFFTSEWGVP